ncbi:uncharacterized protein LOC125676398 [Ostrea edulis]|uniref:uncharacterized protein LOC125676398 n=1 Tax=Ostrea edulis TaxID=37623 RepID=UPI0024AFDC06|nr:uncharacterized protein LOC125676398 [Ostrea edulis]
MVEDTRTSSYLNSQGITWTFNSPHSSHMGGVLERIIGVSRRMLDSLLSDTPGNSLTRKVLVTFMCEVMAIVNARSLVPVSNDPDNPLVLSPSVMVTQMTKSYAQTFNQINQSDVYKAQWTRVQTLTETFWKRWSREFLQTLQKQGNRLSKSTERRCHSNERQ